MLWQKTADGIIVSVKIIPKACKSEVMGVEGEELKLRIAAIPEKGKANIEVVRLLSKKLKIAKSRIVILSGQASRHKRLLITGVSEDKIDSLLGFT